MSRFDGSLLARAIAWTRSSSAPEPGSQEAPESVSAIDVACALARRFEGLFLLPYLCPAGIPTIGYGATYYVDGRRVTLLDKAISREAAERLLLLQVKREYLPAVMRLCPGVTDPSRLAALIDFAFNLGASRLAGSTLRKKVNAGDWDAVPTELMKWVFAGGRKLRGLIRRCEARVELVMLGGSK